MTTKPTTDITLTIDGLPVTVPAGTTVFDAARMNGIPIPTLCHQQNENPVGVCRVCVVDVGARVYAASCIRPAENGMKVQTATEGVLAARHTLVELLMSDHPSPCARQQQSGDCELERLASTTGVTESRFPKRATPRGKDDSSAVIAVDHESCILCDRCIRGCDDIRTTGYSPAAVRDTRPASPLIPTCPWASRLASPAASAWSCPTGALTNKRVIGTELGEGEVLDPAELLHLPIFQNVSGTFLELNQKAVVKRHYRAGEIICREGDFGSTAFYILEGKAEVYLSSPIAHVKTAGSSQGFFSRLKSILTPRGDHQRSEESSRPFIPIDAAVDLPYDNPSPNSTPATSSAR